MCGPERCHDSWFPGSNLVANMRHFINYVRVRVPETAPEVKRDSPASTSSDSLGSLQVSVEGRKEKRKGFVMFGQIPCLGHLVISKRKINVVVGDYKLSFIFSDISKQLLPHLSFSFNLPEFTKA